MYEVIQRLAALAWPEAVSRPAFETGYDFIPVTNEAIAHLSSSYGISVNNRGQGNVVVLSRGFTRLPNPVTLGFEGSNNICLIEAGTALRGGIFCHSNCVAVIMGGQHALNLQATLYHGGQLFWGKNARTYGCRIWTEGGRRAVIGDDCLFSEGIMIRTSDHHSIIDLEDFSQTNVPEDVVIGRHVWVSPNVQILRGVNVGTGAIIGAASVVTSDIPATELWAGAPARCRRKNVSWVDSHPVVPGQIAVLRELLER